MNMTLQRELVRDERGGSQRGHTGAAQGLPHRHQPAERPGGNL